MGRLISRKRAGISTDGAERARTHEMIDRLKKSAQGPATLAALLAQIEARGRSKPTDEVPEALLHSRRAQKLLRRIRTLHTQDLARIRAYIARTAPTNR
ncbi:MAG: hypothetical protein H6729_11565 [Deltaproteobacteria bacterium]|nr:hypothetical protein [Deltaproteobacteria bacterium]